MILFLAVILAFLLVIIGGEKGIKTCVSLVLNIGMLLLYILLVAKGFPFVLCTVVAAILFIAVTLIYQGGWNAKTIISAVSSCSILLVLAGGIFYFVQQSRMAGLSEVDMSMDISNALSGNVNLSMQKITVVVILLGTLGAVMDTAMSVSTAVYEVYRHNPDFGVAKLVSSGNRVGKDILGTTANTLFFAGLGEALTLGLFFYNNKYTFAKLINSQAVFEDFTAILIANAGCVLVIPLTSLLISVYLVKKRKTGL